MCIDKRSLERIVRDYGLDGLFDWVQGMPNTLAEAKFGAGRLLMDRFDLDCRSTLVVGDTAHDAELAQRLRTDCILMSTGHHSERRLAESKQPIMSSLEALAAALI
jgi:phosphoglycolate phosphatase